MPHVTFKQLKHKHHLLQQQLCDLCTCQVDSSTSDSREPSCFVALGLVQDCSAGEQSFLKGMHYAVAVQHDETDVCTILFTNGRRDYALLCVLPSQETCR